MLATPTTATLSVMRTFISVPSRDFTVSKEPSMASIVPRTRTVGGCCAQPADPSTDTSASDATSARGINQDIFAITFSLRVSVTTTTTSLLGAYSAGRSCDHHRRPFSRGISSIPEIGLDQRAKLRRDFGALTEPELEPAHCLVQQHAEPIGALQSARPRR